MKALLHRQRIQELRGHVLGLPRDHRLSRLGEPRGSPHPLGGRLLQQNLERERDERIAGDDGMADTVLGPKSRAVPPFEVAVDDVVVDEREIVDHLDGDGTDHSRTGVGADRSRRDERDTRAHELSSTGKMLTHRRPQGRAEAEHGRLHSRRHHRSRPRQ